MKALILAAIALLSIGYSFAQKVKEMEVPKAVVESFNKNFKGAKADKWEKENGNEFEAEFKMGKNEMSANFSADGKLIETETEIAVTALPKSASDYIAKEFDGYKVSEAAKIDASGKISYEAEISKGKEEMDLIFDDKGSFIKKVVETKEEKDKN